MCVCMYVCMYVCLCVGWSVCLSVCVWGEGLEEEEGSSRLSYFGLLLDKGRVLIYQYQRVRHTCISANRGASGVR